MTDTAVGVVGAVACPQLEAFAVATLEPDNWTALRERGLLSLRGSAHAALTLSQSSAFKWREPCLQPVLDDPDQDGTWILTGSQDFTLPSSISQSLAGRTAILHLLPPSLEELRAFPNTVEDLWNTVLDGAYPRTHQAAIEPYDFLSAYVATYLERDVRMSLQLRDLGLFQTFMRLAAGRTGSLLNLSGLGSDSGVSQPTARSWLTALDTAFLTTRLPPFLPNVNKRLIKTPKLYFLDSGLLCYLLNIRDVDQLSTHPLRGAVFETWVVSEVIKAHFYRGITPAAFFYRDREGNEIDLVVEDGADLVAAEIKSAATVSRSFLTGLQQFPPVDSPGTVSRVLVYGGDSRTTRSGVEIVPWDRLDGWTGTLAS